MSLSMSSNKIKILIFAATVALIFAGNSDAQVLNCGFNMCAPGGGGGTPITNLVTNDTTTVLTNDAGTVKLLPQ